MEARQRPFEEARQARLLSEETIIFVHCLQQRRIEEHCRSRKRFGAEKHSKAGPARQRSLKIQTVRLQGSIRAKPTSADDDMEFWGPMPLIHCTSRFRDRRLSLDAPNHVRIRAIRTERWIGFWTRAPRHRTISAPCANILAVNASTRSSLSTGIGGMGKTMLRSRNSGATIHQPSIQQ